MCDYSLELVTSRPAKVGDKLISAGFPHTVSRGFASVDDPTVAVCLLPGTELAFEQDVQSQYAKRVYENHVAELSKLAEMYTGMVRDASKPIREASRQSR